MLANFLKILSSKFTIKYCSRIPPHIKPVDAVRCYHWLRGSASPALKATGLVDGRWQFSTPQNTHPLTDHQKIGTGDYVGGPYGCTKFVAHPSMGGFGANG